MKFRTTLDGLASVALIAAAATLIWVNVKPRTAQTKGPSVPADPISIANSARRGSHGAKVGVVVYSDFQCPFCGTFARKTMPQMESEYLSRGTVLFAFKNLPIEKHAFARPAAEGAECANRQARFWEMHDLLFLDPKQLDADYIALQAKSLSLDMPRFKTCMSGEATALVQQDLSEAIRLGIQSTPTFLVGLLTPDLQVRVQQILPGAVSFESFKVVIDKLLKTAK